MLYWKGGVNGMTREMERFTLRLPKQLKSQLEAHSDRMCMSLNALLIQILREWADRNISDDR